MSFNINCNKHISKIPWRLILIFSQIVQVMQGVAIYPTSGDWECHAGRVMSNHTIKGGIHAGKFKNAGFVRDITECSRHCCNEMICDVALVAKNTCYLVHCNQDSLCRPVPAASIDFGPQISYVTHQKINSNSLKNPGSILTSEGNPFIKESIGYTQNVKLRVIADEKDIFGRVKTKDKTGQKRRLILDRIPKNSPSKAEMFFQEQSIASPNQSKLNQKPVIIHTDKCYPTQIHSSVSLRYGPDSGDFYDYGEIGDMRQCIDLCCNDKLCDVSFMVGKTCYTVSCYSFEKCQMIPASKKAKLKSQLAYVIKKTDVSGKRKLTISKKHESFLESQEKKETMKHHETEIDWQFNRERDGFEHNRKKDDEPNIPTDLTKHCRHKSILKNHALIGGQRAGVYTFRGLTPGFAACLNLCCADLFCDAAFLLGKRCYSVQCYKNGQCASRPARTKLLHSTLSFIERSDQLDISEKRTDIPGLLPTDRQYTIYLNVTNEDYKDEMVDSESLEFLNFAEKLKEMVSQIYVGINGFKYVEVLKLKPNKLRAIVNITTDNAANPKVLLQKMVDVLRKGELKTQEEPVTRLTIDVRGFKFLNSKGENMICPPEYNYDVHWPLGVYGTFVSVPCPRKANGLTTRQCHSSTTSKAKWLIPDFSDCVTDKYESLFREVQLLTSSTIHTPDLTSESIIDRLLQLTTADTYGANPPKEFESINKLENAEPEIKKTKNDEYSQLQQLPIVKTNSALKENLSSDQMKNYLRKMGLAALLGKTNQPDMMTLYKSLSSRPSEIQTVKPQILKGATTIKYEKPRVESEIKNERLLDSKPATSQKHHRPVHKEYDKVTDYKHGYPKAYHHVTSTDTAFSKQYLSNPERKHTGGNVYWPQQKQSGDLGAESPPGQAMVKAPVETTSELVPASETSPVAELKTARDNSNKRIESKSAKYLNSEIVPYFQPRPASVTKIDFEPISRSSSINKMPFSLHSLQDYLRLLKNNNVLSKPFPSYDPAYISMEPNQRQNGYLKNNQLLNHKEMHPVGRQDLAEFYSHSSFQPNGVPMYENRRDSTAHPQDQPVYSTYPKRGINNRYHSIRRRKRWQSDSESGYSFYFPQFESLNRSFPAFQGNSETANASNQGKNNILRVSRSYKEPKLVEFFVSDTNGQERGTSVHSNVKFIKAPEDKSFLYKNESSNANSLTGKHLLQSGQFNATNLYVKKIEKPIIVDIPTGNIVKDVVHTKSKLEHEDYKENPNAVVAQYDASLPKTEMQEGSTTSASSGTLTGKAKVITDVNVRCTGEGCPKQIPDDILKSKQSSKVIGETQINDGTATKQVSIMAETTVKPTIVTTTKESKNKVSTTRAKRATTKSPETTLSTTTTTTVGTSTSTSKEVITKKVQATPEPTVPPIYPDIDETEPENEGKPQLKNIEKNNTDATQQRPKPVITITVVNKTNGMSIDSTIETEKKPVNEEKQKESKENVTNNEPSNEKKKPGQKKKESNEDERKKLEEENLGKGNRTKPKDKEKPKPREESELIFTYDKEEGKTPAPLFGGDIMLTVDIAEELAKYAQSEANGPSLIEIEEFLQTASTVMDEKNDMEWKNAIRHLKLMAGDNENNSEGKEVSSDVDSLDWRVMHKQKSVEKHDLLLGFVSTVELYGKAVSSLFSRYNAKFQKPIITKNIIMQVRVIVVEELLDKKDNDIAFPDYGNDQRLTKWSSAVEKISIPGSVITDKFEPTKTIHVTYFRFKNIAEFQKPPPDEDGSSGEQDFVDENPIKVGSQLLSMSIDPPINKKLKQPVSITFANCDLMQDQYPHSCAYWNNTRNAWQYEECELVFRNSSVTTCECNHLTTFGVLVDTSKKESGAKSTKKPYTTDSNKGPEKPPKSNGKINKIEEATSNVETKDNENGKGKKEEEPIPPPVVTTPVNEESDIGEEKPNESEGKPTEEQTPGPTFQTTLAPTLAKKRRFLNTKWFWILLISLLLLLLMLILLIVCCCYCRHKKRQEISAKLKDIGSESSGPDTGPATEKLVDKSKEKIQKEDPRKGMITPGSTSSSRTNSPEPGKSPGWRKLMSHAHHPKQILLKEKALLFKDYVQPYHFLSEKDPPNTSVESIYGSTIASFPQTVNSDAGSGKFLSPRRKRNYEPLNNRRRASPIQKEEISTKEQETLQMHANYSSDPTGKGFTSSSESKSKRKPISVTKPVEERMIEKQVMPSQMTEATSMEWDPYLESKQKLKKSKVSPPRTRRNISPISEEDEDNLPPKVSTEVIAGSDAPTSPASSETSYIESVTSSTRTVSETGSEASPRLRRNIVAKLRDSESSDSQSTFIQGERRKFRPRSESSENGSPLPRRFVRTGAKPLLDSSINSSFTDPEKTDNSNSDIKSPKTPAKGFYTPTKVRDRTSCDERFSDNR